jgi:hypothetical protein
VLYVEYDVGKAKATQFRLPLGRIDAALKNAKLSSKQRHDALEKARGELKELQPEVKGSPQKYVEFKIAEVTALMAQDDALKRDRPGEALRLRDDAIKLLTEFKTLHPDFWTIVPALKTLARLQEDSGNAEDAAKTYEALAGVDGVPKELKQESEILVGRLLLRGSKYDAAEKRLTKLADKLSEGDAQKPFVQAYLAEAKIGQNKFDGVAKDLDGVIKGTNDGRLRGVAYNLLGDLHRKSGKMEDAFWAYLRVDALYNDDAEEQAKALYYLSTLFDKVKKDPARGEECVRRLRENRFNGTAYQKLLPPLKEDEKDKETKKDDKKDKDKKK